nr:hypothetical protein [Alkalilimnicola ehrlichii]
MAKHLQVRLPGLLLRLHFGHRRPHLFSASHSLGTAGVGIQTNVADGVLTRLRDMPQDLFHESLHRHTPQFPSTIPVVMVTELNLAFPQRLDPGVCDGSAAHVARQVRSDSSSMCIAALQTDIPFFLRSGLEPVIHGRMIATGRFQSASIQIMAQTGE